MKRRDHYGRERRRGEQRTESRRGNIVSSRWLNLGSETSYPKESSVRASKAALIGVAALAGQFGALCGTRDCIFEGGNHPPDARRGYTASDRSLSRGTVEDGAR